MKKTCQAWVRALVMISLLAATTGCGGGNNPQPPAVPAAPAGGAPAAGAPAAGAPAPVIPTTIPGLPPGATLPPTALPPTLPANPVPPPAAPTTTPAPTTPTTPSPAAPAGTPPRGGSSGGTGGQAGLNGDRIDRAGVEYYMFVPANYNGAPTPFLFVFTGVEGAVQQSLGSLVSPLPGETDFLKIWIPQVGLSNFIIAIVDSPAYSLKGVKDAALADVGAKVIDDVRSLYNIDNDRSNLLGESMGTSAGETMGFHLRQGWWASYYLNDVVKVDAPAQTAAQLGYAPWSQVGPGGAYNTANSLVANLRTAGYQLPAVAPYNGVGSNMHGSPDQLMEAYRFFAGKVRGQ